MRRLNFIERAFGISGGDRRTPRRFATWDAIIEDCPGPAETYPSDQPQLVSCIDKNDDGFIFINWGYWLAGLYAAT
jgi:hypothetical protein